MGIAILAFEGTDTKADGTEEVRLSFRIGTDRPKSRIGIPLARLKQWNERYRNAVVRRSGRAVFFEIGLDIASAIDADGSFSAGLREPGHRVLEVRTPFTADSPAARAFEILPWELLAHKGDFLAADPVQLFGVARRHGDPKPPTPPVYADLALLFMAASPEGMHELDYEEEEAAILTATRPAEAEPPSVHLTVDETGTLKGLVQSLRDSAGAEALHLSCHGERDPELGSSLVFETEDGQKDRVTPVQLLAHLSGNTPELVFVSACYTAAAGSVDGRFPEIGRDGERHAAGFGEMPQPPLHRRPEDRLDDGVDADDVAEPGAADAFTRQLLKLVPNAVGWDGAVNDAEAIEFATSFYSSLGQGENVPLAAARARANLLSKPFNGEQSRDWHLARVYMNARGGGALSAADSGLTRPPLADGTRVFLDAKRERVPVASRREFVGRRREIQEVMRAFGRGRPVLLHGMGNLGKSSLAARVASRTSELSTVVVVEDYDAEAIFEQIIDALPGEVVDALDEKRDVWRERIARSAEKLEDVLRTLLEWSVTVEDEAGNRKQLRADILLVIDDLEHALEPPSASEMVRMRPKPQTYAALCAVLRAFARARTSRSRLLFTSRYDMTLTDRSGRDLADPDVLARIPLHPMRERARTKQLRAFARALGLENRLNDETGPLCARADRAAGGNPWLQRMLQVPILHGEATAIWPALEALEAYRREGTRPEDSSETSRFLAEQIIDRLGKALTSDQRAALAAAALFSEGVPIPLTALAAAARAADCREPVPALSRLSTLGLLEPWGSINGQAHAALNPLAYGIADRIGPDDALPLMSAAVPLLLDALTDADGNLRPQAAVRDAIAFAVHLDDADTTDRCAVAALQELATRNQSNTVFAAHLHHWVPLSLRAGFNPDFLSAATRALRYPGDGDEETGLPVLLQILDRFEDEAAVPLGTDVDTCGSLISLGDALENRFALAEAERAYQNLLVRAKAQEHKSAEAMALSLLAHVFSMRGEHHHAVAAQREAVTLHQAVGDEQALAAALSLLSQALQQAGEYDEALRICREEVLPVYERLADVRSRAITLGKIADILFARGEYDEALRIRRDEELPVFERLADVRERAITLGKIADILHARGEYDEALRIRREEELPVYERLADDRSRAFTLGKIADILHARGERDEALRIWREEELPVYERLADDRSRAFTLGKIADILHARGEYDEALRIHREEMLPVFERLADVRSRALTMSRIADILHARGEYDEALRIRREEELPVYERLADDRSRAITLGKIADILHARGERDEALRIRREEELPVYERLADVRERAVTLGKIADILHARGEYDKALRIRREEQLPVFERLADDRSRAVTLGKIADILHARGEYDEALRIHREEMLPVFERLADDRSRAFTLGKIADILHARGEYDEALRIHREEMLPVFERLADVRSRALTMSRIADILHARGEYDEALRIRREEELPVYERLADDRSRAITLGKIADILHARGERDEALRIRREEELPVYERLADVRWCAITLGQIADILYARGEYDEALRIRREEELPVYEHLADDRWCAFTLGKIADILQARGEYDEALRIRREEQLPVYERLADDRSRAFTLGKIADILHARGEYDEALRIHREEMLPVFERLADDRSRAVTLGRIADILHDRGEYDEALRIRRDEELPVYERFADDWSRAITMGKIADILHDRGERDEALRIRREEELPVFERLADVRERAITLGKIADILQVRGERDEALRIRREEQLPVFERLADDRSRAVTLGKIADILHDRGEYDEALRIHREEMLPVFERLADVRSRALTMSRIADILYARGEYDEALRIRREEELPVYEHLADDRWCAFTLGKIADILQARGEYDEALRIRREEQLPVYERLADVRERAVTLGKIADILHARGEYDKALRIRREEELPVYERLADVRSRALTLGKIADILQARGEYDEALRIHREEMLPVFERLADVRSRALTMSRIADILQVRGEYDEALRIRREEELPVYEQLAPTYDWVLLTRAKITAMLCRYGRLTEARAIYDTEVVSELDKSTDPSMLTRIHDISADLLMAEGHCDEAFATWRESVLPVQQKSGNKRAALVTRSKMLDAQLHSQEATAELRTEAEALLNAGKAQQELDAIAWTHKSAGALLAALGEARQAVPLLRRAAEAFERIGWPTQASLAREQADEIDAEDSCIDPNEG